jgi:hypothetical protein
MDWRSSVYARSKGTRRYSLSRSLPRSITCAVLTKGSPCLGVVGRPGPLPLGSKRNAAPSLESLFTTSSRNTPAKGPSTITRRDITPCGPLYHLVGYTRARPDLSSSSSDTWVIEPGRRASCASDRLRSSSTTPGFWASGPPAAASALCLAREATKASMVLSDSTAPWKSTTNARPVLASIARPEVWPSVLGACASISGVPSAFAALSTRA